MTAFATDSLGRNAVHLAVASAINSFRSMKATTKKKNAVNSAAASTSMSANWCHDVLTSEQSHRIHMDIIHMLLCAYERYANDCIVETHISKLVHDKDAAIRALRAREEAHAREVMEKSSAHRRSRHVKQEHRSFDVGAKAIEAWFVSEIEAVKRRVLHRSQVAIVCIVLRMIY